MCSGRTWCHRCHRRRRAQTPPPPPRSPPPHSPPPPSPPVALALCGVHRSAAGAAAATPPAAPAHPRAVVAATVATVAAGAVVVVELLACESRTGVSAGAQKIPERSAVWLRDRSGCQWALVVNTSRCLSSARSHGSPRVATEAVSGNARRHAGLERRRQKVLVHRPSRSPRWRSPSSASCRRE